MDGPKGRYCKFRVHSFIHLADIKKKKQKGETKKKQCSGSRVKPPYGGAAGVPGEMVKISLNHCSVRWGCNVVMEKSFAKLKQTDAYYKSDSNDGCETLSRSSSLFGVQCMYCIEYKYH